jgi:Protein of unknown function (DUF3768)
MKNSQTIRALNDRFRSTFVGGVVAVTQNIADRHDVAAILAKVKAFDAFDADNDPYAEHDFGAFDRGDDKIFWKIEYYNKTLCAGSPDPADPAVTTRVLMIMLAQDY